MAHQEHTQGQTSFSEIHIQALREDLDTANKKVDRYVHLVASLFEELDNLRRSICHDCKTKFVPSYAPVASPSDGLLPSRIHIGDQIQPCLPSILTTYTRGSPNSSIPIHPTMPLAHSSAQLSTPLVEEMDSKQPNSRIKQALHIDLGKTFTFTSAVFCVKFSPDGKYLAVGLCSGSGKTYLYDVEKGLKICCLVDLYLKNQPSVECVQFSPDNKYIATASGKQIRLWEIARIPCSGVHVWSLRDGSSKTLSDNVYNIFCITFSPDGQHIASVDLGGWLRLWDVRTGQLLDTWNGHTQNGRCVAFSPDGKGLVSGGGDGILRYWDVSLLADMEKSRDRGIGGIPGKRFQQIRKFEGHTSWIRTVSFSPDSRWIATGSLDQSLRIWDPQTEECQCTLHGHDARTVDFWEISRKWGRRPPGQALGI